MELFRFIKWQWKRYTGEEKFLIFLGLICLSSVCWLLYTGAGFLAVVATIVVEGITGVVLWGLFSVISEQWEKYNVAKEREAREIMSRLKGESASSGKGFF